MTDNHDHLMRLEPGDLINQDELWQSRQGEGLVMLRLDEMETSHLENLRAWLLRNATTLHSAEVRALYGIAGHVGGEQALIDLDCAISSAEEEDPRSWITEKPLFRGITRRLDSRH